MNAETDAYYGRSEPSSTYKWGLVLPVPVSEVRALASNPFLSETVIADQWRVVAWFPSRKNAEAYARRVHGNSPWAIARANLADAPDGRKI